ncbi:Transcriptional regulator, ArsR family [Candidatus Filomicrobium marinum]|uniref:Transcriptional regulator, ArsR family n=2 Tax=Filomicrobium TaxID=119044 RepID=A0A0D6JK83_9HYPH|nr:MULTISPECIES: metalloregulator ArsR/SmtB family transcription factor [Filomicrobium]MCV0370759.1 metalloregulator ArsR/SmtB family transcription factor [Filomicrobium sp.]CFX30257.1 Transcriptional regulator, ArsR family [Candidatus Filomicrobium marinum]CPR22097.1 Transcriptional regulator, ArsR family [Candidatus Filomicrobium marinum]SDP43751.1 transcriptional regulator, ArsR family [Filomicrobium insigne]
MYDETDRLNCVFHALSDPTRREIVSLLAVRPYSITELVPPFSMSLSAISKHVKSLERAGIVYREVRGRNHICTLNADALNEAYTWLSGYERFWNQRLDALEEVLRREGKKDEN